MTQEKNGLRFVGTVAGFKAWLAWELKNEELAEKMLDKLLEDEGKIIVA